MAIPSSNKEGVVVWPDMSSVMREVENTELLLMINIRQLVYSLHKYSNEILEGVFNITRLINPKLSVGLSNHSYV